MNDKRSFETGRAAAMANLLQPERVLEGVGCGTKSQNPRSGSEEMVAQAGYLANFSPPTFENSSAEV